MRDRVALITGGASGIGRALGEAMAARGASVVLVDRQHEMAQQVADEITGRGGTARALELDVRESRQWERVVDGVERTEGRIDYLFNNAGIGIGGEICDYELATWDDVIDVNLRGVAYGVHHVYPIMRRQGSGHIINTASMAGLLSFGGAGSYVTTKHAVVGMSKALRVEARRHGVRVSVLCPGAIQTPILSGGKYGGFVGSINADATKKVWQWMRPMQVDDFAQVVLKDVERNEPYIIVPRWWKSFWVLERIAPRLSNRMFTVLHGLAMKQAGVR